MKTEVNDEIVEIIVKKAKDKIAENNKKTHPEHDSELIDYLNAMIKKEVQNAD